MLTWRLLRAIVFFFVLASFIPASAQERDNKGYISIGLGPSIRLNGEQHPWAMQPSVELGYEFGRGIGVVGTWIGSNYLFDDQYYYFNGAQWTTVPVNMHISCAFWSVGPMYVARLNRKSSIDLKARIGQYNYQDRARGGSLDVSSENSSLGYYLSASYQYRWLPRWTLFSSIDYATNRKNFRFDSYGSMSTLGLSVGFGFRY
jgi:hypothetical protein